LKTPENNRSRDKKNEVLRVADKVGSYLYAKKTKETMASEIVKNSREMEYIRGRLEGVRRSLDQTLKAIREAEGRLAEPRERLARLESEKQVAQEEYEKLSDIERDIVRVSAALQEKKEKIEYLRAEVEKKTKRFSLLQSQYQKALSRRMHTEDEVESHKATLKKMEEETSVKKNTLDILSGKMPESISIEDFMRLQRNDVKNKHEEYVHEVRARMESIENRISVMKAQIDEKRSEGESLSGRYAHLQWEVADIEVALKAGEPKEHDPAELSDLRAERDRLTLERDRNRETRAHLEVAMVDLDNKVQQEKEHEADVAQGLSYLTLRKKEMDTIEHIETEFKRLSQETQRLGVDVAAYRAFQEVSDSVKEQIESINTSLRAVVEECSRVFHEFDTTMQGLEAIS
jgi:chromosome segregation ATPase